MNSKNTNESKPRERPSFLKKRSKRLLCLRQRMDPGHGLDRGSGGELKVSWFFSSEKNILAFYPFHILRQRKTFHERFGWPP
jgi:hypothetical protein